LIGNLPFDSLRLALNVTLLMMVIAGGLWVTAFTIYLTVYGPVLLGPRVDGRPG
jgi:uncharacterized protein involved in response to NO